MFAVKDVFLSTNYLHVHHLYWDEVVSFEKKGRASLLCCYGTGADKNIDTSGSQRDVTLQAKMLHVGYRVMWVDIYKKRKVIEIFILSEG